MSGSRRRTQDHHASATEAEQEYSCEYKASEVCLGHKQTFAVQNGVFAFTLAEHTPARCLHQKIERDTNDPCAARGADLETVL